MPQYTTSYSTNKKRPTYRRAPVGQQLPSSARRRTKKPGATYLHHTQGFGHSNRRRRGTRPNKRNPYALIAVGCALLLFVAAVIGYTNRNVDVELNGSTVQVRINSTLEQLIDAQGIEVRPGNLLAVARRSRSSWERSRSKTASSLRSNSLAARSSPSKMVATPTRSTTSRRRPFSRISRLRALVPSSTSRRGEKQAVAKCGPARSPARHKTAAW